MKGRNGRIKEEKGSTGRIKEEWGEGVNNFFSLIKFCN
jgi:hypothetical protein